MKNVTISLSEDLVHILDGICKDCNTSRYAFAKEAILGKIERHTKNESKELTREDKEKTSERDTKEKDESVPPFFW